MRNVALAAGAGLGLLWAGTFAGSAGAMVGIGSTAVQNVAQEVRGTLAVAVKKKMKKRVMRHHAPAAAMTEPHFGGSMSMNGQCWVDPDGRGVSGYWTGCK
jgi:hypothetical protein